MTDKAPSFHRLWQVLQRNRPIRYCTNLAQIVGSVKAAILLSQMIYWTKKGVEVKANDGWFRKRSEHWTIETGLTRHEQDTARKLLVDIGFLEIRHVVAEGKKAHGEVHYRLNLMKIGNALADLIGKQIEAMNPLNLDDLQSDSEVVRLLLGRHVSYHRALVDIAGSTTAALLLSKMIYLQRRAYGANGGEWFSVTTEYYRQELGMNRRQQETARKALLGKSLIAESLQEDWQRHNRRLYQRVDIEALIPQLQTAIDMLDTGPARGVSENPTYKTGNLKRDTHVQNRQPENGEGFRKCTRVVAGNVRGRLPEMYVYTNEELQGLQLQIKTTTTTTTTGKPMNTGLSGNYASVMVVSQNQGMKAQAEFDLTSLFLPKGITGQELKDFAKWVLNALPHRRQLLIDEFEYQRNRRVIVSPVGYIRKLVERDQAANGELPLEGAYNVARIREAEAAQQAKIQAVHETPRTEAGMAKAKEARAAVLAMVKSRRKA